MILFTILALIAVLLIGTLGIVISVFGASSVIVFGDVIVCIVFIVIIMKHLIFKD